MFMVDPLYQALVDALDDDKLPVAVVTPSGTVAGICYPVTDWSPIRDAEGDHMSPAAVLLLVQTMIATRQKYEQ